MIDNASSQVMKYSSLIPQSTFKQSNIKKSFSSSFLKDKNANQEIIDSKLNADQENLFTLFPKITSTKHLRWDNLILIPLRINHENTVVFQEDILWNLAENSPDMVRDFAFDWVRERFGLMNTPSFKSILSSNSCKLQRKRLFDSPCFCETCKETFDTITSHGGIKILLNSDSNSFEINNSNNIYNPSIEEDYKKSLSKVTLETLEMYSFVLSKQILQEIEIYRKLNFVELLKLVKNYLYFSNIGSSNEQICKKSTVNNEYLININLDLNYKEIIIKDSFEYDLLSEYSNPEDIAKAYVQELNLSNSFVYVISLEIRKQIRIYLFNLVSIIQDRKSHFKELEKNKMLNEKIQASSQNTKRFFGVINKADTQLLNENVIELTMNPNMLDLLGEFVDSGLTNRQMKHHKPAFLKNNLPSYNQSNYNYQHTNGNNNTNANTLTCPDTNKRSQFNSQKTNKNIKVQSIKNRIKLRKNIETVSFDNEFKIMSLPKLILNNPIDIKRIIILKSVLNNNYFAINNSNKVLKSENGKDHDYSFVIEHNDNSELSLVETNNIQTNNPNIIRENNNHSISSKNTESKFLMQKRQNNNNDKFDDAEMREEENEEIVSLV